MVAPKLYLYGALVALLAGTGLYIWYLRGEVQSLSEDKVRLEQQVQLQNAAVEQMKTDAEKRAADAKMALDRAQAETKQAQSRANALYKSKPGQDTCKSALDLLNSGAR